MSKDNAKKTVKKLPSKTTLNLAVKVKTLAHPTRLIPILLIIFLGSALFAQYAVIHRLNQVKKAEAELSEMKNLLELTQAAYADYDEVELEYNKYTYENFDRSLFDRLEILEMIQRQLFPACKVQTLNISHNTSTNSDFLSLTITGPSLEQTYAILNSLLEEPIVDDVNISSFVDRSDSANGSDTTTVVMTISLIDATTLDEKLKAIEEAKELLDGMGLEDDNAGAADAGETADTDGSDGPVGSDGAVPQNGGEE